MSDRPTQLIIIVRDGVAELFSAHHASEGETLHDRLKELGANVHLITVPEIDGVVKSESRPMPAQTPVAEKPAASVSTAKPAEPKAPVVRLTPEQFQAETLAMMDEGTANGMWRDADAPLSEAGAVS